MGVIPSLCNIFTIAIAAQAGKAFLWPQLRSTSLPGRPVGRGYGQCNPSVPIALTPRDRLPGRDCGPPEIKPTNCPQVAHEVIHRKHFEHVQSAWECPTRFLTLLASSDPCGWTQRKTFLSRPVAAEEHPEPNTGDCACLSAAATPSRPATAEHGASPWLCGQDTSWGLCSPACLWARPSCLPGAGRSQALGSPKPSCRGAHAQPPTQHC